MRVVSLVLLLSLIFLMPIHSPVVKVYAVDQAGPTYWSPFGSQTDTLQITQYSRIEAELEAFLSGQIDITDYTCVEAGSTVLSATSITPLQFEVPERCVQQPPPPEHLREFRAAPQKELGIYQLDRNYRRQFMGVNLQQDRGQLATRASFTAQFANPNCPAGFGEIIISLRNLEQNSAPIKDALNTLTIAGPNFVRITDAGGQNPTGEYRSLCQDGGLFAGNYVVRTDRYSNCPNINPGPCTIAILPGKLVTYNFDVGYNSPSTKKLAGAALEIGRAVAHLVDKPNLVNEDSLGGQAEYVDVQAPPAQGLIIDFAPPSRLSQTLIDKDCEQHPWIMNCGAPVVPLTSAYNIQNDNLAWRQLWWSCPIAQLPCYHPTAGYSGPSDLHAACDHFVAAGFQLRQDNGNGCGTFEAIAFTANGTLPVCAQGGYLCPYLLPPNGTPQKIVMVVVDSQPQKAFGQIIADGLNLLFANPSNGKWGLGGNAGGVCYGPRTPTCETSSTYFDQDDANTIVRKNPAGDNDWNLYTGGWKTQDTDHLYENYHSSFASNLCSQVAGIQKEPRNYPFYCSPKFDGDAAAGKSSSKDAATAAKLFARAALAGHFDVMTVPIVSRIVRQAALNGWNWQPGVKSSLVSAVGSHFEAGSRGSYFSLLNMRCNPDFVPDNASFVCGGGQAGLIRRGFSLDVRSLSPFHFTSSQESEIVGLVYDSMLKVNPLTAGVGSQVIDWMTKTHSSTYDATLDVTTQRWSLRSDLKWQDGVPVKADDVCFSILTYRDVPSSSLLPAVSTVLNCNALTQTILTVTLQGLSPYYELDIGELPIIPHHAWASACSWPIGQPEPSNITLAASLCADPNFDPMQTGIYIGNGPWGCKNGSGIMGGPCTSSGTQEITLDQVMTLSRYHGYMRCCPNAQSTSLQQSSWADGDDNGVVNILDIAFAALVFDQSHAYWNHPLFGADASRVDIAEIATIAFYFDHGTTQPFVPSQLTGMESTPVTGGPGYYDPGLDPFELADSGHTTVAYYHGFQRVSDTGLLTLVQLTGPTGSYTATLSATSGSYSSQTTVSSSGSNPQVLTLAFTAVAPGGYRLQITGAVTSQEFEFTV